MEKQELAAVITGDIVKSSLLGEQERIQMLATLNQAIAEGKEVFPDWNSEIFQGDSFQASTFKVKETLRFAIGCIARFKALGFGLRIAIGIGEISFASDSVRTSDGTAFLYSGRTLETLKKGNERFIGIKTVNQDLDAEWEVYCTMLDFLLARCTASQAKALFFALKGLTQVQIAENLNITQPTVQQHLKACGWLVFKAILQRFDSKY